MEPLAPPLPTFLIIGAQKSATRWLRLNLGLHPDVFTAAARARVLQQRRPVPGARAPTWYREQFEGWAGEPIVGEATPGYMFWRHRPAVVSERIQETLPDVRLIATLRNPIDRAQSAMVHHIEYGTLPRDSVLIDLVQRDAARTRRARDHRGRLVRREPRALPANGSATDSSSCSTTTSTTTRAACTTPRCATSAPTTDFVPPEFERVRFSHQQQASTEPGRRPLTLDERRELWEFFAADVAKLEQLIGRDLSLWEPS